MHNLFRLSSLASLEGQFYKYPRIDRELLAALRQGPDRHHRLPVRRGADAGCGTASTTRALQAAADFRDILGKDNFFCELMDHGIEHRAPRPRGPAAARPRTLDLPLLATNDLHYTYAEDAKAHEVLLCVQTGTTMAGRQAVHASTPTTSTSSRAEEMRASGRELPEALRQHPADRRALRRRRSPRAAT